jgi:hypothetical protein
LRQLRREYEAQKARRRPEPRPADAPGDRYQKTIKPAQQRDRAGFLTATFKISARRACRLLKINKSTYYYKSTMSELNVALAIRIKEIAAVRVR